MKTNTKPVEKTWIMWLRPKGTFSIGHLLSKSIRGWDVTVCGMKYPSHTLKKVDEMSRTFRCSSCQDGVINNSNIRGSVPIKL